MRRKSSDAIAAFRKVRHGGQPPVQVVLESADGDFALRTQKAANAVVGGPVDPRHSRRVGVAWSESNHPTDTATPLLLAEQRVDLSWPVPVVHSRWVTLMYLAATIPFNVRGPTAAMGPNGFTAVGNVFSGWTLVSKSSASCILHVPCFQ
jgi:hypothetical protein